MRTIHLNIPDIVDLKDYDFLMIVAAKLYEDAKLSSGQAAQIVGLSKEHSLKCSENLVYQYLVLRFLIYILI